MDKSRNSEGSFVNWWHSGPGVMAVASEGRETGLSIDSILCGNTEGQNKRGLK